MNHMEFAALESAMLDDPTGCERWLDELERLLGFDLDGDQAEDGYSLDGAVDMFDAGMTAAEARTAVLANMQERELTTLVMARAVGEG